MTKFIYLHGFASSPSSKKATAFKIKFNEVGIALEIPDLEGGDFKNMTLSSQMNIILKFLDKYQNNQVCIIGSSMGGYLAILAAQKRVNIHAAYLMAPGFNFLSRWMQKINLNNDNESWKSTISVFHYRYGEPRFIDTNIFKDAIIWTKCELKREFPTRIVHGVNDEIVPISESRKFVSGRPWCTLNELSADHGLLDHIELIVNDCLSFFKNLRLLEVEKYN